MGDGKPGSEPEVVETVWPRSAVILGAAGLVGSGVAARLVLGEGIERLTLYDTRTGVVAAHALDLGEAAALAGVPAEISTSTDPARLPGADLVVLAAAAAEPPSTNRRDFLRANLAVLADLAPHAARCAGELGVILVVTNPVDVVSALLQRETGLAPERIVGYSLNDSVRLRIALARELSVPVHAVEAWVLGEHGQGQVPLFSSVRVHGSPVSIEPATRRRVRDDIDGWFARWSALRSGRSSGWTTPVGVAATVSAMRERGVVPASVWSGGRCGMPDTYVTLPARLSPAGLAAVEPWNLDTFECQELLTAACSVDGTVRRVLSGRD